MSEREKGKDIRKSPYEVAFAEMSDANVGIEQRYAAYLRAVDIAENEGLVAGIGMPMGHEMNPVGIAEFTNWTKKIAGEEARKARALEEARAADRAWQEEFDKSIDQAIADGKLTEFLAGQPGQDDGARFFDAKTSRKISEALKREAEKKAAALSSTAKASASSYDGGGYSWGGGMQPDQKGKPNEKKGVVGKIADWFKGLFGG